MTPTVVRVTGRRGASGGACSDTGDDAEVVAGAGEEAGANSGNDGAGTTRGIGGCGAGTVRPP